MTRALLNIELKNGNGDNIQLVRTVAGLCVSVEEPWAGDTESGFGRSCSISLNSDEVESLRDFLNEQFPATLI